MSTRFTRMGSNNVLFQAHVSEDSHYVLLPVMERASQITGWLVYDTVTGMLYADESEEPFPTQHQAREWVQSHFYAEARAG